MERRRRPIEHGRLRRLALAALVAGLCLASAANGQAAVSQPSTDVPLYQLHWRPFTPAGLGGSVSADGPYLFVSNPTGPAELIIDTRTGASFTFSGVPPGEMQDECSSLSGGGRVLDLCIPTSDPNDAALWEFILAARRWQQVPTVAGEFGPPPSTSFGYRLSGVGTVWADIYSGTDTPAGTSGGDTDVRLTTGAIYDGDPPPNPIPDLNLSSSPYTALCKPLNINDFMRWITPHTALMYRGIDNPQASSTGPLYVQSCNSRKRYTFSEYSADVATNDSLMIETPNRGFGSGVSHVRLRGYDGRTGQSFELSAPPTGGEEITIADGALYASVYESNAPVEVAALPASLGSVTPAAWRSSTVGEPLIWRP